MKLTSPKDPFVSVHRHTSFLRACDPVQESKQDPATRTGLYCTSIDTLTDRDSKSSLPRSYTATTSPAFYPALPPHLSSQVNSPHDMLAPRSISAGEEEIDEDRKDGYSSKTGSARFSKYDQKEADSILQKRKLSLSPSASEKKRSFDEYETRQGQEVDERDDVKMRPFSSAMRSSSERLPGIAQLDEQMHTPWSSVNARRHASLREGAGEDVLRRFASQTFSHGDRPSSFRAMRHGSIPSYRSGETSAPSVLHSPRLLARNSELENGKQRVDRRDGEASLHSTSLSPRIVSGAPGYLRHSPGDREPTNSYHRRTTHEWSSDERGAASAPHLPTTNSLFRDHRAADRSGPSSSSMIGPGENADNVRRPYGDYPDHHCSHQSHYRGETRSSYPYESSSHNYSGRSDQRGGPYSHRPYDRGDSPGYYAEEGAGGPRLELSSPHQQPYVAGGPNTSPSILRRRGKLPKAVTDLLKTWLLDHASHPYPTEDEKRRLCSVTGLTISQVSNWFINARRRILVPQGSGNFALGHVGPGGGGGGGPGTGGTLVNQAALSPSPPLRRLASPKHYPAPPQPHQQQQQHGSSHHPQHLYDQASRSHSHHHHTGHLPPPHHDRASPPHRDSHAATGLPPLLHQEEGGPQRMYRRGTSLSPKPYGRRLSFDEQ